MTDNELNNIKSLEGHPGWEALVKEIQEEHVSKIETRLLNESDNEVKYTERDLDVRIRKFWLELIETPETLLSLHK